eukprot:Awhi_evm1s13123
MKVLVINNNNCFLPLFAFDRGRTTRHETFQLQLRQVIAEKKSEEKDGKSIPLNSIVNDNDDNDDNYNAVHSSHDCNRNHNNYCNSCFHNQNHNNYNNGTDRNFNSSDSKVYRKERSECLENQVISKEEKGEKKLKNQSLIINENRCIGNGRNHDDDDQESHSEMEEEKMGLKDQMQIFLANRFIFDNSANEESFG